MSLLDPGGKRWDSRVMDRARDRYWAEETRFLSYCSLIVFPAAGLYLLLSTVDRVTPVVVAAAVFLIAIIVVASLLLVRRIGAGGFAPRRQAPPVFISDEELKVDEDSRRKAFDNLKRFDD
jgi:hypothetical protein